MPGELGERVLDHGDVIGSSVGPGVARAQPEHQRLTSALAIVVDEGTEGWNPKPRLKDRKSVV